MPTHYLPFFTRYSTDEPGVLKPQAACGAYVPQVDVAKPGEMPSCLGCQEWLYRESIDAPVSTPLTRKYDHDFSKGNPYGDSENARIR